MRKLFRIALAVALVAVMAIGTAFAADTTVLEGTNGTVTDAVNNAEEGAQLVITVKCVDATKAQAGWGVGGICIDGGWDVDGDFTSTLAENPVADQTLTFTFDCAAIKTAATGDINVNYYNGFEVVKAVVRTADGGSAKTADTTTVVLFGAVAVIALVAVVASKKARA